MKCGGVSGLTVAPCWCGFLPLPLVTFTVHRIGRTGRCGKTGVATTFVNKTVGELAFCFALFIFVWMGEGRGKGEGGERERERERESELKNFILQGLRQRELACWLVTLVRYTGNHLT